MSKKFGKGWRKKKKSFLISLFFFLKKGGITKATYATKKENLNRLFHLHYMKKSRDYSTPLAITNDFMIPLKKKDLDHPN